MSEEASENENAVWVKTMPTPDGAGYMVTIEADDDTVRALTPSEAVAYATDVLAAVARAEHDAAVARQMSHVMDMTAAAQMVKDLRADRPPLDPAATAPIGLECGVTKELFPFLIVSVNGKPAGQWTMQDAREHAFIVLTSVTVADLDSAYLRLLTGMVGIDKATAFNVVEDLTKYR